MKSAIIHKSQDPMVLNWFERGRSAFDLATILIAHAMMVVLVMLISGPDWAGKPLGATALYGEEMVSTTIFSIVGALTMRSRMKHVRIGNAALIYISAFLTANGGGTIRDLLIGRTPFWMLKPEYAIIPLLVTIAAFVIRTKRIPLTEALLRINDNFGTGVFILIGVSKVAASMPTDQAFFVLTALCTGALTGMGGGILRDIFLFRKIPSAFKSFSGLNALLCAGLCAYFLRTPPFEAFGWEWLFAGTLFLTLNMLTAGRTFTFK